jgi:DNA-binding CsgD family transcriptional regulator
MDGPDIFAGCAGVANRLAAAEDAGDVARLLSEAASVLGADAAAFASFVKDDETYASYRFILACDARWCLEYEGAACYLNDPWLEYARRHAEPILAEKITVRTDREREVVQLARHFGFASAIIVPAQAPYGLTRLGGLCLGSAMPGRFETAALSGVSFASAALALRLLDWQIARLRQELLDHTLLSAEDIALLRYQQQGRGTKEIAQAMNTTSMSVDSRWQRINAKLGVSSRVAATRLAAEYGVI